MQKKKLSLIFKLPPFFYHHWHSFYIFLNLFLAVLGFCCCAWAFSSQAQWGILSFCWAWGSPAVAAQAQLPSSMPNLPDQGLNPCPLGWQADSQSLNHEGCPSLTFLTRHCELISHLSRTVIRFLLLSDFTLLVQHQGFGLHINRYPCSI